MPFWNELGDFLRTHEDLAQSLGIRPNAATGEITDVELVDVLGGVFDVWPESLRHAYINAEIESALGELV